MSAPLIVLDRIVSVEPGKRAVGLRNVPQTLAIFDSHFPARPVLPGVLVLGTLGELAQVLLGPTWRLAGAERVRYRHFIRPGDQIVVEVELSEQTERHAVLKGSVKVDGTVVTSARALRMEAS
ncbi:3-hydroxyacyl-ACP dehydratase FabZ [Actinocorallia lasiicapitis]